VKTRWFALPLVLVAIAALVGISSAGAKKPKAPPPATHGIVTKPGTPGTITTRRYAPDGVTSLDATRVKTSAPDTSASIAARLGTSAPEAIMAGAMTQWDVAGRLDAPVAQGESAPDRRSIVSAQTLARARECCSSSGCKPLEVSRASPETSSAAGSRRSITACACWSYRMITRVNVACWSTVHGPFVSDNRCDGRGHCYARAGSAVLIKAATERDL
jgi:hypothetical protein